MIPISYIFDIEPLSLNGHPPTAAILQSPDDVDVFVEQERGSGSEEDDKDEISDIESEDEPQTPVRSSDDDSDTDKSALSGQIRGRVFRENQGGRITLEVGMLFNDLEHFQQAEPLYNPSSGIALFIFNWKEAQLLLPAIQLDHYQQLTTQPLCTQRQHVTLCVAERANAKEKDRHIFPLPEKILLYEWKSQFPVGKVFTPPLLLSDPSTRSILGPLCFNPKPQTLTLLFSSPSLFRPAQSPPQISLSSFLSTSSLPLSTSSSIASQFGPQHHNDTIVDSYNCLQLLHCPNTNKVIAFFSAGYNHDQLGFLLLSFKDSGFTVLTDENDEIFMAKNQLKHRICKILVNPVAEISGVNGNSLVTIGYLLACTMYSAHWFSVKVNKVGEKPTLSYLGFKLFKSSSIVSACWSPHLVEESVVLLQSGTLFMFDLDSCVKTKKSNVCLKGKRLKVSWDDYYRSSGTCKWLGCDFSWHPRILIVARSDAVFLVDLRSGDCNITVLAKIDMLNLYSPVEKEQFLLFRKAGSDGFNFVVASDSLLVLCDVRKPLTPALQWAHGLLKPSYIDLFRLSELRANSRDNMYEWADEFGFGIVLGSLCNCEFSLFCYGPSLPSCGGTFASEVAKICKTLYAWDLPSDILLSGRGCCCGSCLTRKEFFKDALPTWIDSKQKKDIVLGFGILNKDLSRLFYGSDEFGGFTLVRLMSSGKLEAQRYYASLDLVNKLELAHGDSLLHVEDNILFMEDEDYKFRKRYKYFKFDSLYGYLSGDLPKVLDSKMKNSYGDPREKDSFSIDFHEILCEKLRICGFSRFTTSPAISFVFNDIGLPTNIHEIALRRMWAGLPMELLQLAFSSYTEFLDVQLNQKKVSLEFSVVPDLPQLPPFYLRRSTRRSNKWSQKVQHGDSLVGPVMPLPVLITLHEFRNGCPNSEEEADRFSSEAEVRLCCDEVKQVAREMAVLDSGFEFHNDHAVSLADDRENFWVDSEKPKAFISYHLSALESSTKDKTAPNYVCEDVRYANLISKVPEYEPCPKDTMDSVALDLLDDLSPIALKFDDAITTSIMPPDLKAYDVMKRDYSRFLKGSSLYQDYCNRFKLKKQSS
ncbi:hypothetical protein LWI28_001354 [Acer negundo]|uniref:Uncharacterized protein n=1 Tax=Acer negundo TaxID=4023 RepID=A0AAD5NPE9_ACENE|nr:hypothetical protein LWI28_001354 [Acer negundo]